MIPQFKQNKINGISIAWGRANWDYEENCYIFPTDDSYRVTVSDQWLMDAGVTEDDLLDCVIQVEQELGSPKEFRRELGLVKHSGYSNIGTVVRSRTFPALQCVFTPTSTEDHMPDAYFEWYFDTSHPSIKSLQSFLKDFNNAADVRLGNVAVSPVMPSYMEAQQFFDRNRNKFKEEDRFLAEVWKYHQTQNKGFKVRLGEELLPQWVSFQKSINESDDRDHDILKWIEKLKDVVERETSKNVSKINWKTVGFDKGPKFYRVFTQRGEDRSAAIFIDKEGNIYKAAGWKSPAKGMRGTIDSVDPENIGKMLSHTLGAHKF